MKSNPGIRHNIQSREENAYIVPEGELEFLGSFNFMASLLAGLACAFVGIAVTTFLNATPSWTTTQCIGVFGGLLIAITLFAWCPREVFQSKSLIARIKSRPKPKHRRTANTAGSHG